MRHVERESGHGAEHRDTVLRTVVFAFVSLAAWWCCSNVASADDTAPATPATSPPAPAPAATGMPASEGSAPSGPQSGDGGKGLAAVVEMLGATEGTTTQGLRVAAEPEAPAPEADGPVVVSDPPEAVEGQPGSAAEPGVMAGVVLPLVAAVEPALAPVGEVIDPVAEAVTTPLAPLVQTVVPVVDQVAGPVLGPVVTPLVVQVLVPVVEQASSAVAPVAELVAPVLVPVAKPVVGLVAPVVRQLATAVAEPVVAAVRPAVRSVVDLESRVLGLRPATTALAREAGGSAATAPWALVSGDDAAKTEVVAGRRSTVRSSVADSPATVAWDGAGLGSAAPAAAPGSPGAPFRPTTPAQPAVVMAQGGTDTSQRTQRLVAVLSPAAGLPAARLSAPSRTPAVSPLARFGGRPPVTPD